MSSDIPPYDQNHSPAEPSRAKKIAWAAGAIAVVLVLGLIVHARIASHRAAPGFNGRVFGAGATLAVGVAQVTTGDVPVTIDSLGTVTPLATVTVHPQVTGPLVKIPFSEGQMVKAGDLLAEIDPRPFQAAVDQAQGQLEHDQALLANARVDLDRYKTLVAQNSVAEQTYATQQATVLQDEATIATDKASLETARLNLSYCRILSPVSGSVGLRQVDVGNVVSAYSSSIVVVTQLQPMSVLFTVPEDNLTEVLQRLHHGDKLQVDAYDRTFTTKLDTGVLANSDNEVDTTTGTLKLRALFNNSTAELFPDQFVNVRLTLDTLHNQMLVPGAAVQNGSSGTYVYVVDQASGPSDAAAGDPAADPAGGGRFFGASGGAAAGAGPVRVVHVRAVSTGPQTGNFISITQGLQPGETVVVDGAEQLRDGARVTAPDANAAPGAAGTGDTGNPDAADGYGGRRSAGHAGGRRTGQGGHPGASTHHRGYGAGGAGTPGASSTPAAAPAAAGPAGGPGAGTGSAPAGGAPPQ